MGREEIIYGRHSIEQALSAGRVKRIWALNHDPKNVRTKLIDRATEMGIHVDYVERRYLDDRMGRANHQGIIAKIKPFEYCDLETLIESNMSGPILLLDKLNDPGNLGNIIRTAAAFTAKGIILAKDRAVGVTPAVEKAASGMIAFVPIAQVPNLSSAIETLKKSEFWIYGADSTGKESIETMEFSGKIGLVLGAEASGLSRLVKEKCDFLFRIPIAEGVESLNVASAASICLYEIARQSGWEYLSDDKND